MYHGVEIILATKHKKEQAIRIPFKKKLQAQISVPDNFDTDQFGTFTGEIPRKDTPYDTVIKKATMAAFKYHFDYAIGSEGSFGPHPGIYFCPADTELMSFIDVKNNLIVVESEITPETNYAFLDLFEKNHDTLEKFLEKIKFPSHAVIVRSLDNDTILGKGITCPRVLYKIIKETFYQHQGIRLETDMRAMMNPTRMKVINKLAFKLVKRLQQLCHQCGSPGFGKISLKGFLPCKLCGNKTELYQSQVLSCVKCDYQQERKRPDGLVESDPGNCSFCNP